MYHNASAQQQQQHQPRDEDGRAQEQDGQQYTPSKATQPSHHLPSHPQQQLQQQQQQQQQQTQTQTQTHTQTQQASYSAFTTSRPQSSSSATAMSKSTYYDPTSESRSEYRASSRDGNAAYPQSSQYAPPRSPGQPQPTIAYSATDDTSPAAPPTNNSSNYQPSVENPPRAPYSPLKPLESSPPAYSASAYQNSNGRPEASSMSPPRVSIDGTPSKSVEEPKRDRSANIMSFNNILSGNPETAKAEPVKIESSKLDVPEQETPKPTPSPPARQPTPPPPPPPPPPNNTTTTTTTATTTAAPSPKVTSTKVTDADASPVRIASPVVTSARELTPRVNMEHARRYSPKVKGSDSTSKKQRASKAASSKAKHTPVDANKAFADEVRKAMASIDVTDTASPTPEEYEIANVLYKQISTKRRLKIGTEELAKRKKRRLMNAAKVQRPVEAVLNDGQLKFGTVHTAVVEQEVQQQDIADEKERKKDMQRKRRREKALETEKNKADDLRARAENVESDGERAKLLKEAAKAEKKIRDTQRKIDGVEKPEEINEVVPSAPNFEGGTEGSFLIDVNGASPEPAKKRVKTGGRLKKTKEQKEAEKARAAAADEAELRGEHVAIAPKEEAATPAAKPTSAKEAKVDGRKGRRKKEDEKSAAAAAAAATAAAAAAVDDVEKEEVPVVVKDPFSSKAFLQIHDQIWRDIARKDIPKVFRIKANSLDTRQSNLRKTAQLASKEARRWQQRTNKSTKDVQARAKRSMREMMNFWKRNERQERDLRKNAERQELDAAKRAEAEREANRQKRKLNFLISQTELYSHFIGKKIRTDEVERSTDDKDVAASTEKVVDDQNATHTVNLPDSNANLSTKVTDFDQLDFDAEDESKLQEAAMANAQAAIQEAQDKARAFNNQGQEDPMAQFDDGEMNFQNPTSLGDVVLKQPAMLTVTLKDYQLKGLNWLANLYEQGINGILADEMGLGKTIQSICVMAYLAETHNIWGPFLVVAPASTLHNWQQEISRFVPDVKTLPYWGTAKDRKVLRKFWDRKHITYTKESPFHVLVTSYQLVVQDAQYFQKIRWQYMILDEAQNIKSSQSARWKTLLGFHCRNRLLLTGTPIQNNMQELWALLHFIMPSLFDSHDEFSDWFSKDIESHAQSNTKLNEDQLKRLHMILKPFMLRRVKQHVQKELGDKIELDVFCDLTYRQRALYSSLRNKISIMDLIEKAAVGDDQDAATLMNLVMQFRKVCNHPDLFERAETTSPLSLVKFAETGSFLREGSNVDVRYSTRNVIAYELPRLLCSPEGRLDLPGPQNPRAGFVHRYLDNLMNIWTEENITESSKADGAFSWLRFVDTATSDVSRAGRTDLFARATRTKESVSILGHMNAIYEDEPDASFTPKHSMLNIVDRNDHTPLAEITDGYLSNLLNVSKTAFEEAGLPILEQCAPPAAAAPPITVSCSGRAADIEKENTLFNVPIRKALYPISLHDEETLFDSNVDPSHYPVNNMLSEPINRKARFTDIQVPSMRRFVTDSGKLAKLDELLRKLKAEGHRVLLYFQMTRMIDLMEEYLTYRNYKYCRLDGSTKLEDRRDTVADFQTRPEIFIFLLSTRAGGLGINLTSADTVIFYDSDWNPTIDSQAMDRAHRLGQTKQVTVYRMITSGTIEERIRKRSLQKEEMQRVVMTGGAGAAVNFDSRARENKTKDIAMWLADDEQAELIEKKEKEMMERGEDPSKRKKKAGGRKRDMNMDDFYHEGEGNFDDSAKPSGAATPMDEDLENVPKPKRGPRGGKGTSKKAKTAKQRLAIADGAGDI